MLIGIDAHWLEGNRTGVGRYLFNLLKAWSRSESDILSRAPEHGRVCQVKFVLYFKDEIPKDLPQSSLFKVMLLNVKSTAKFIHWDLCRAACKDKVDVLFCPAYIAPLFYSGKIALTLHDIIYETHPEWFEWKSWADKILLKWVSKISARKAALIFTISDFSRQEIIEYFRIKAEKIKAIPLAGDIGEVAEGGSDEILKNQFGIKDRFGFYVGSIFNRRHLSEIIDAFSRIAQERSDFQLLLAGKDHTKPAQDIRGKAEKVNKKLERHAILRVDFVNDHELKLLYNACAFFIYLSDYEGFGLPPLEAMALGAPTITSDATSLKEVAGSAALLVKENSDTEEIYQAMKKIIDEEALRSRLIEKGKEQAAKFSWKKCAEETLSELLNA
ncbi:MAG: glycosyltransferase family 1 protein [bacterium]